VYTPAHGRRSWDVRRGRWQWWRGGAAVQLDQEGSKEGLHERGRGARDRTVVCLLIFFVKGITGNQMMILVANVGTALKKAVDGPGPKEPNSLSPFDTFGHRFFRIDLVASVPLPPISRLASPAPPPRPLPVRAP
jgi:hypothetical protein